LIACFATAITMVLSRTMKPSTTSIVYYVFTSSAATQWPTVQILFSGESSSSVLSGFVSDPNGAASLLQMAQGGRSVLGDKNWGNEEEAKTQRKKSRKSLGRRVSFAPDAHLETMHLYPQV
jgi:hypothetical protein